jgi:hypothetical protein
MLATIQYRTFFLLVSYLETIGFKIFKTPVLLVIICGFETWFLTFTEDHRLRVEG